MPDRGLRVQVVYARPGCQEVVEVTLPDGATVRDAIERSKIVTRNPEIDLAVNRVGVHGRLRNVGDRVRDGDRVEIYRPLAADPKDTRRARAKSRHRPGEPA